MAIKDFASAILQSGFTRANSHYYYGNKLNPAKEVIVDYVRETLAAWEENWRTTTPSRREETDQRAK